MTFSNNTKTSKDNFISVLFKFENVNISFETLKIRKLEILDTSTFINFNFIISLRENILEC